MTAVPAEEPTLMASGKFALYKTPRDGLHIALKVDGEELEKHLDIPPMMVKLAMRNPLFMGQMKEQFDE